ATVTVSPPALALVAGATARFTVTLKAADGSPLTGRSIVWTSADPGIAQVDASGAVLAVAAGATTITVTSEGVSAQARVDVSPKPVAAVELRPNAATIDAGARLQLQASVHAADGTALAGRTVTWTTSDASVAKVDANGMVTGVAPGVATITASAEGAVGQAAITVRLPAVASVTVSPASASLNAGDAQAFVATAHAADGTVLTGRPVTWTSSDPAVVTVDAQGSALAIAAGTATITATVEGVAGQAAVTVSGPPPVPVATVTVVPATLTLRPGDSGTLTAEARAGDGTLLTGRPTTWSSSDAAVATVNASGQVTAVADGAAKITATVEGVAGSASVTVSSGPVPVASVTVQPPSATLNEQDVLQLQAQPRAADNSPLSGRTVTWSSSDPSVASVNGSGRVRAKKAGSVIITATSEGVDGTASITVQPPVETVQVRPGFTIVRVGVTIQYSAELRAADNTVLTGKTVTWTTSNGGVATIDANGKLTTRGTGAVVVTATCEGKSGSSLVWVLP
ncbi:MAG: Ig-like domain-containing protein, partial [Longimicrobiales bacterium]